MPNVYLHPRESTMHKMRSDETSWADQVRRRAKEKYLLAPSREPSDGIDNARARFGKEDKYSFHGKGAVSHPLCSCGGR